MRFLPQNLNKQVLHHPVGTVKYIKNILGLKPHQSLFQEIDSLIFLYYQMQKKNF